MLRLRQPVRGAEPFDRRTTRGSPPSLSKSRCFNRRVSLGSSLLYFSFTAFAAAVLFSASTLSVHAQSELVERQVTAAPGHDVRVGVYINLKSDCSTGPLPTIRL